MKAKVNENCIGCGSCVAITDSKIFDYNDDGLATCVVDKIEEGKDLAKEAAESCPTSAIELIEED